MSTKLSAPATAAESIQQETALVLEHLGAENALMIGQTTLELAKALVPGRPVAIHLETDEHPLFVFYMDGTGAGNTDWINKKKNVTRKFNKSSWTVRLEYLERNENFQTETGLDPDLFRAEGGAIPLNVRGKGRVGTMTVSGLDGWEDHALAVCGLENFLGKERS